MKKITSYRIRGKIKKWTMLFGMSLLFSFSAFSQTNIAPLATITAAGGGAAGCQTGPCSTLNDLNLGTCGTQQMWINTGGTPSTVPGVDWIQWDFPSARTFDTLVIHHGQSNARFLTGATVQYWDGATWVTHSSFSGLPQQCINRVSIGRLTADRFRITAFIPGTGQLSNQNFREIEIIEAPTGPNDAAAFSVDSPMVYCSGSQNVVVTIGNLGTNVIDSVDVNWEVNGVAQPTVQYIGTLDTIGGLGLYTAQVNLGNFTFPPGINTLKIYTSNPNGVADTSNANDTIVRFVGPGLSGNYTVNISQATGGTNFNSFTELAQALNVLGICGPVNVTVSPGVYNESFHLNSITGLSPTDTILIDGQSPSQAVLRHDGQGDYAALIYNNVSYVTVQNLTIENDSIGDAVIFKDASHNRLLNNICKVDASSTNFSNFNVVFSSSTTGNSSGTEANHNLIADNHIIGGYYGVYMYGATTNLNTHNRVINNDIDSAYYYGVYGYYQDSLEVENNNIDVSQRGNQNSYGLMIYYSNNTVANANYVRAGYAAGYFYNFNTYSPANRRYMISNNMFISDGQGQFGVYMYYVDSVDIFHNSINTTGVGSAIFIGGSASSLITSYDVRNNIFNAASGLAFDVNEPDTIFDKFNNNLYNTGGGTLLNIDGVTYLDLPAYQLAQPLLNTASLEGDPQFVSSTNLHIVGAYVNDQGDNSVNITEDIDGDPRPITGSTIVDIGADEYDPPTCPPPSNINIGNLTANSAVAYYIPQTVGNDILYEIVPCGSPQGSSTIGTSITDSIAFSGLNSSSCYEIYIREVCTRGDSSIWSGPYAFNTLLAGPTGVNCNVGAPSVVFSEEFDNLSAWTGNIGTGTQAGNWNSHSGGTGSANTGPSGAHSGNNYAYVETSGGNNTVVSMVSPLIDLTQASDSAEMSFWLHAYGAAMGNLTVGVSTSATGPFTSVFSWSGELQTASTDPFQQVGVRLDNYVGQAIYLEFSFLTGNTFTSDIGIDLLEVRSCVTCPSPSNQSVSNISLTSADFDWVENGTATDWEILYGAAGFPLGTGTSVVTTQKPYTLSALTPSTSYEYYVRSICAVGDTSAWEGPFSFGTANGVPYIQDFEAWPNNTTGQINEEGWYTNGTPALHWEVGQSTSSSGTGPSADHTIGAGGTFVYLETSGGTTGDDDTLYSPPIYIDTNQTAVQLEFWYHMHGATMGDLEVFVDTNGTLVPVATISGQQHPVQADPWLNSVYSLTGFEGKSVQILFVGTRGTSFTGDMAIDDVSLQSVTCPAPNSLTDTIVGMDSVVISWTGGGGATNWDLEFGPAGFAQGNGTLLAKTDTFHLVSGLQTNIAYEFYVRDSCGVNDVSAWMGPYSFGIFEACDDMDGYPTGPIGTQSMLIQPWAGAGGDAEFSTDFASSGTQSLKIYDSGLSGFSDAVAVMNPYTSGAWNVSVDIYIPSGFGGYYNILHNYTGGTNVWAIEVYMDSSGVATVDEGTNGTATIGTYSFTVGAWNTIEHIIDLSADTATILVNGNPTNVSWQFSLGSANFGNQFNAFNFFSAANTGQTPLIYFDDFCVSPHLPTSIKKVDAKETSLNFYPNPTAGEFTVSSSGLENNNARLTIRDITGKVVLVDNIANSNSAFTKQYNLSDFAKGMYFISILDGENRINQKLIVQ